MKKNFGALVVILSLFALVADPATAECDTELKQTDGYQQLSEKLKCLENEIGELKRAVFPKSNGAPPVPPVPRVARGAKLESGDVRLELEQC